MKTQNRLWKLTWAATCTVVTCCCILVPQVHTAAALSPIADKDLQALIGGQTANTFCQPITDGICNANPSCSLTACNNPGNNCSSASTTGNWLRQVASNPESCTTTGTGAACTAGNNISVQCYINYVCYCMPFGNAGLCDPTGTKKNGACRTVVADLGGACKQPACTNP